MKTKLNSAQLEPDIRVNPRLSASQKAKPPKPNLAQLDGPNVYLHLHPGQRQAWHSTARFVAVLAGIQGGKTSFGPYWLWREMRDRGPGDVLVVTPTFPLLEMKLIGEFRRLFESWFKLGIYTGAPARRFIFTEEGMRRFYGDRYDPHQHSPTRVLFGYASDPESLESATVVAAWCDEAGQKKFRLESWQAILRRLSLAQGRALITTSV